MDEKSGPLSPSDLVAGRTLADQELIDSLAWLTRLRWLAGAGVLLGTAAAAFLRIAIPQLPLNLVGLALLVYNAGLLWGLKRLMARRGRPTIAFQWFARLQIGLDWLAMTALIHYTGGIESPALFFFMFHITIASLLLPHDKGFLYVTLAPVLVGEVAFFEYTGRLPHYAVLGIGLSKDPLYLAGVLFFFTCSAYVMAYFCMSIARRLRRRENEVSGLYWSIEAATSTLNLPTVMNKLAEATARVLNCKGASIRLLDRTGRNLEMVTAYGLSPAYLEKKPIDLSRALIDQEALAGATVLVTDAPNDFRIRYPEKIRAEGIRCILSAPLLGKGGPLGVLRAYGDDRQRFTKLDAAFLTAVASHGAVAIENARAYQMRLDTDREKSRFLRMVTHELRSPANAVRSLLAVLQQGYAGELSQKQAELVGRAIQRTDFMQTLVNDLLDLAAGKSEGLEAVDRSEVSLTGAVRDAFTRFEPQAQAKGLKISLESPEEGMEVWGDASELQKILDNLLSNAVKYTLDGGVGIRLEREGEIAILMVSDTGIGIPGAAQGRVFDEFYRASNAKNLEERGTGLGLAIVRDLVGRYNGTIDIASTEGKGTSVTIQLPLSRRRQVS